MNNSARRLSAFLLAAILGTALLLFLVARWSVDSDLRDVEVRSGRRDVDRVLRGLQRREASLVALADVWTAGRLLDEAPSHPTRRPDDGSFSRLEMMRLGLSFMARVNEGGEIMWCRNIDRLTGAENEAPASLLELARRRRPASGHTGLAAVSGEPFVLAWVPIESDLQVGSPSETLVLAEAVDTRTLEDLGERSDFGVRLLSPDAPEVHDLETGSEDGVDFRRTDEDTLLAYAPLPGMDGEPVAWLRFERPRDDVRSVEGSLAGTLVWVLLSGIVFGVAALALGWRCSRRRGRERVARLREFASGARVPQIGLEDEDESFVELAHLVAGLREQLRKEAGHAEGLQRRLDAERSKADTTVRTRSKILANMSHEIRTPLNGVIGMTELALQTDLTAEQREYLREVMSSAQSLLSLLNDVLDASGLEGGSLSLESVSFDIRSAIEESLFILREQATRKGIEIECLSDPELPCRVKGDPSRVQQILVNIVGIALKFTEEGNVVVRAEQEECGEDWLSMHVSARGSGPGLPEHLRTELLEGSGHPSAALEQSLGGAGLGLTVARHLVARMGGRFWAVSRPGEGSTFHFTVRFRTIPGAPKPWILPQRQRPVRALIVDDSVVSRMTLRNTLDLWGVSHDEATDGWQALDTLRRAARLERPYDLLILDRYVPALDGPGVLAEVGSDPSIAGTRAILTGPGDQAPNHDDLPGMGVVRVLRKPMRQEELLQAIRECLQDPVAPVRLPVAPRPEKESRKEEEQEVAALTPLSILLVEDNAVNRLVATRLLERQGHTVTLAGDGVEAVEVYRDTPELDVVLMDVDMPRMDGLEATRRIRQYEAENGRWTPIIAMTAMALSGDRERCLAEGMDDYVSKPFRRADLEIALLRTVFAREAKDVDHVAASQGAD